MEKVQVTIKQMFELMGISDCAVNCDVDGKKLAIFINEGEWFKKILPKLILEVEHLARLVAKKNSVENVFIDYNLLNN